MEQKKKILIIEDERTIADTLRIKLESADMESIISEDGEDGLRVALEQKPDLILLDLILPKLDGMTLLEKLREDEWGKSVPVIILSNLGTGDEMKNADKFGVAAFLVKTDFRLEDVVTKVLEVLQEKEDESS